jgi:hypothetical protein
MSHTSSLSCTNASAAPSASNRSIASVGGRSNLGRTSKLAKKQSTCVSDYEDSLNLIEGIDGLLTQ